MAIGHAPFKPFVILSIYCVFSSALPQNIIPEQPAKNGVLFNLRISVGKNGRVKTIYNVGIIEEAQMPTMGLKGPIRSKTGKTSDASKSRITEGKGDVKQNPSDENLQKSVRDDQYMKLAEKKRYTATDEKQMRKSVEDAAEEAMKNSKVRGEDGELLVVYHGTEEDFTVFDIGKGRASMDIQGAFFSPYMDDAEGYGGKVGAYYLNITNPADEKTAREVFQKYRKENNAGIKARQELEAMGYDGVINEDEYIAFRPEQIKSADLVTRDDNGNIIPLSQRFNQENPDVRYSVRSNEKNAFNPKGLTLHDQLQDSFDSAESFDRRYIYVGEFEGWFLKALRKYVKVEGLPIVMNYRDAYLAMHTKETGKYHGDGINYHSLGVTGLQNALESIDRTNAVMISKKGPEKIEIALDTVDVKNNRCLSIIAINTTAQSSGTYLATHVVTSVYGRKNIDKYIKAAEDEGRAIKIEAPASVRSQVQYEGAMITGASDGRIPEASEDVNLNNPPKMVYRSTQDSVKSLMVLPVFLSFVTRIFCGIRWSSSLWLMMPTSLCAFFPDRLNRISKALSMELLSKVPNPSSMNNASIWMPP